MFKLAKLAKRTRKPSDLTEAPDHETLKSWIVDAIKEIYDPEIPVNIYDLGLIYDIDINDDFFVNINMTLTAPACPVAEIMPAQVKDVEKSVKGVSDAEVTLVWDPPWSKENISEEALLQMGLL